MWKVYKDDKLIKEFEDKKEAHKFKDDLIDRDMKNKEYGHKYKAVKE